MELGSTIQTGRIPATESVGPRSLYHTVVKGLRARSACSESLQIHFFELVPNHPGTTRPTAHRALCSEARHSSQTRAGPQEALPFRWVNLFDSDPSAVRRMTHSPDRRTRRIALREAALSEPRSSAVAHQSIRHCQCATVPSLAEPEGYHSIREKPS